jgi:PBP1b-binding outer membrane lipoprotein LpoB
MKKGILVILGLALLLSSCKDEKESESKSAELQKFSVSNNYVQGCGSTATGGRATVMTVNGVPFVDARCFMSQI